MSVLVLLLLALTWSLIPPADSAPPVMAECKVNYVKRGCYHDELHNRRLPDLMLYGRKNLLEEDWGNWHMVIPAFICNCAKASLNKGYKYFGIQFYTECWGGNVTASTMQQSFKEFPDGCVETENLGKCNDQESALCVGKSLANYVYEVVIPTTKPPAVQECKDSGEKCNLYAQLGLCTDKYPEVLKICKLSCKLCKQE